MKSFTEYFNEIDQKFTQLERRSGNDPTRIDWLVKNSPEVRRLVGSLFFLRQDFEEKLQNARFVGNVPEWFIERYKYYKKRFEPKIDEVYSLLWLEAIFPEREKYTVDGIPYEEILNPDGRLRVKDTNQTDFVSSFSPGVSGASDVVEMNDCAWKMVNESCFEDGDVVLSGLEAWDWFTEIVGIDLAEIEKRWGTLPRTLIPRHVEQTASATGREGFIELLDEATNAYVFGLPAAAMAMCRALCEQVLKEFYFGDSQRGEKHVDLIILAERKYKHVEELKLGQFNNWANRVMHNYQVGKFSDDDLEIVQQYLQTIKTLIELSPEKTPE